MNCSITLVSSRVETFLENPFDYRLMTVAAEDLWYASIIFKRYPDLTVHPAP